MDEWISLAGLTILGGTVVAFITGLHTVIKALRELWIITKPVIAKHSRSSNIIVPTSDEIIRYSIKPFDWKKDDRTKQEQLRELLEVQQRELQRLKQEISDGRLMTMAIFFGLAFLVIVQKFIVLATQP